MGFPSRPRPRIQVGFNTAQSLARDDPKAHGDQGTGTRIEQPMRPRHADEPVPNVGSRSADGRHLRVFAETIFDLAIPSPRLLFQYFEIDEILTRDLVHAPHELGQGWPDDEIFTLFLEGLHWRRSPAAAPGSCHLYQAAACQVGVLLRT